MTRTLRFAVPLAGLAFAVGMAGCGGGSYTSPGGAPLTIVTSSLPNGTIGTAYSQTIRASGGTAPFTWTVASGTLPDNVSLAGSSSSSVSVSGTPDRVQAGVGFTIQVTDAKGSVKTQSYSVSIASTPTVAVTQSGAVQGIVIGNLIAFRGIPFAAPPLGNLRWKVPQPPASWSGVRNASAFGNICEQINYSHQLVGSEDCLVLNVYVSQTPPSQNQPVMFFLHGGGNEAGSTQDAPYDLPLLANQGVVVVTAEYRLGMFGFMANPLLRAEDGGSSGHYALADQVAALAWVQNNIAAFGGDPAHVMLFGQSAGSYDIQALLVAPSAQGLFSVAGMESNVIPLGQLPTVSAAEAADAPIVSLLGCSSAPDVLACLRAVPAGTIATQTYTFPGGPGVGSAFVPVDPALALQQNGSPVPLLIGSTREEWTNVSDNPNTSLSVVQYAAAIHNRFDPIGAGVATQVLTLYPVAAYSSPEYALIAVDSDYNMTCEVRNVARVAAGTNRKPVWRYFYTHTFENDASLSASRAFHTSELYFVFDNFALIDPAFAYAANYAPTPAEVNLANDMMGYWTRFAATGDPNGAGATTWPPYDANTDSMLQLDDTPVAINGYHNTECDYLSTLPQP